MFAPRGWLKRPVARRIYRTIASSELFDARWYRSTQVSGFSKLMDPLWHYLDHGAAQGLDPSPWFDTSHYVHAHHDVRSSGLNPLFHYLEYGIAERRSPLRSVVGTRDALIPETTELQTFTSPRTGSGRVTLVADYRSQEEHPYSLDEIVMSAEKFAQKHSRILRVIMWPGSGNLRNSSLPGVVVIEARRSHPLPTFDIHADEIFVATSTTSALSLRHAAPYSQLWKLSSEKGMEWEKWSAAPELSVLPNYGSSFGQSGFPRSGRIPVSSRNERKTLAIFADAHHDPGTYLLALEALEQLFLENSALGHEWHIAVCGRGVEPLMLAGTFPIQSADHISQNDISRIDVAILTAPDQELETWCGEREVPIIRDFSVPFLSSILLGTRP